MEGAASESSLRSITRPQATNSADFLQSLRGLMQNAWHFASAPSLPFYVF
jgi:hypothetical protein